jgi:predicted metalloprotease
VTRRYPFRNGSFAIAGGNAIVERMRTLSRWRARTAAVVLLLTVPALAGCSITLGSTSSAQNPAAGQSGGADSAPAGVIVLQHGPQALKPPAGFSCPNQNLRGCFTSSDEMVTYYEFVLPFIDAFFQQTWPKLPLPDHVYFMSTGSSMQEGCGDPANGSNQANDTSYEFCPADNNVYIGQQLAFALYSQAGDVAPATGLAHELGHHIQSLTSVPVPRSNAQTLVHENQADCVSGAFLGFANNHHWLEPGDAPVLQKYLDLIASSENDPNRTHGDFQERGAALELGGKQDIKACDSFYPDTPIA